MVQSIWLELDNSADVEIVKETVINRFGEIVPYNGAPHPSGLERNSIDRGLTLADTGIIERLVRAAIGDERYEESLGCECERCSKMEKNGKAVAFCFGFNIDSEYVHHPSKYIDHGDYDPARRKREEDDPPDCKAIGRNIWDSPGVWMLTDRLVTLATFLTIVQHDLDVRGIRSKIDLSDVSDDDDVYVINSHLDLAFARFENEKF